MGCTVQFVFANVCFLLFLCGEIAVDNEALVAVQELVEERAQAQAALNALLAESSENAGDPQLSSQASCDEIILRIEGGTAIPVPAARHHLERLNSEISGLGYGSSLAPTPAPLSRSRPRR